ncbi:MAG TPA: DUF4301 family protein, partial [Bacteroidales bacterium]|nr:DUF4301 family protein [Bacteroidales bacterium]
MFTSTDLEQFNSQGIGLQNVGNQLARFKEGFPFVVLVAPATIDNGIVRLDDQQVKASADAFDAQQNSVQMIKFVPASGAATRMFKDLFEFQSAHRSPDFPSDIIALEKKYPAVAVFIADLHRFPFTGELQTTLRNQGLELRNLLKKNDYQKIIHHLLDRDGMNYAALPKGLLSFHRYPGEIRTAMEEHLVEGAAYCRNVTGDVRLHFTVSPEHLEAFRDLVGHKIDGYGKRYGVTYQVDFSVQKSSTDTLAVDLNNEPFRNSDGRLLFRPAGHGALIENLNDLEADVIFIKNIDNVVPDHLKPENTLFKKALAGYLLTLRQKVFTCLKRLQEPLPDEQEMNEMALFARDKLFMDTSFLDVLDWEKKQLALFHLLHRPIRVCGMVKNVGEPGG